MKKAKLWANNMVLKCGAIETPLMNIIENMMGTQFFLNPTPTLPKKNLLKLFIIIFGLNQ
jgi:hypothetical protein